MGGRLNYQRIISLPRDLASRRWTTHDIVHRSCRLQQVQKFLPPDPYFRAQTLLFPPSIDFVSPVEVIKRRCYGSMEAVNAHSVNEIHGWNRYPLAVRRLQIAKCSSCPNVGYEPVSRSFQRFDPLHYHIEGTTVISKITLVRVSQ